MKTIVLNNLPDHICSRTREAPTCGCSQEDCLYLY